MSYRTFALLVIFAAIGAISYVVAVDDAPASAYCELIEIGDSMRLSANQKIGEPIKKDFQFENTRGRTIVVTGIKPRSEGVELTCSTRFPIEMKDKERFDFSLSVTPGPSDYERIVGAFVYWKELDSEIEKPVRFEFKYRCTHDWIVTPTHIELGSMSVGKELSPVVIEFKRLKDGNSSVNDLQFESNGDIEVVADDLPVPLDTPPEGDVAREISAHIKLRLPTPTQPGGYVKSLSIKDRKTDRVEVIHISGTVASN